MYWAQRGQGAFVNLGASAQDEPLHTSGQEGMLFPWSLLSQQCQRNLIIIYIVMQSFNVSLHDGSKTHFVPDITKSLVVTEIGSERDDLALSTMTTNIKNLLKLPIQG